MAAGEDTYFAYDGDLRRVEKQTVPETRRYHWDGLNVTLERQGESTTLRTHVHGTVDTDVGRRKGQG